MNYLYFSDFKKIEIIEIIKDGTIGRWEGEWDSDDPFWIVRGRKI
jgi:hypothetical protein